MKVKSHCRSGHVMKRDGDSWKCTGKINGKKKIQKDGKRVLEKINCPNRKAWSHVAPRLMGGI